MNLGHSQLCFHVYTHQEEINIVELQLQSSISAMPRSKQRSHIFKRTHQSRSGIAIFRFPLVIAAFTRHIDLIPFQTRLLDRSSGIDLILVSPCTI